MNQPSGRACGRAETAMLIQRTLNARLLRLFLYSAVGLFACSVFEPPPEGTDDDGSAGSTGDAGAGGPWWARVNGDQCQTAGLPTRDDTPETEDPGASVAPFYLGLSKVRYSANDDPGTTYSQTAWTGIGFDLDGLCTNAETCTANGPTTTTLGCATPGGATPSDGQQCRDNQVGRLITIASASPASGTQFGLTEADWNCELRRGGFGVIWKISDYNGLANDRQVRVDMYTSTGLVSPSQQFLCRKIGAEARIEGTLDANWPSFPVPPHTLPYKVTSESLASNTSGQDFGGELPPARDHDPIAFVRDGYLYAKFPPQAQFWLNGRYTAVPGIRLVVEGGFMVGKLFKNRDGLWTLDEAGMGGMVDPGTLIDSFRELGFCENMCSSWDFVNAYLNNGRDAIIGVDEPRPEAACNALTVGMDIEARQVTARAADIEPAAPAPVKCGEPRHPAAPRQGQGPCQLDGGTGE